MRKIIALIFLLFTTLCSIAQAIGLEIMNSNTIIHNAYNPIKVMIGGQSCSKIFIKTEAIFEKNDGCTWLVKPIKDYPLPGLAIDIFEINQGDSILLERRYLKVKRLETLVPDIGLFYDLDTISISQMNSQVRITATNYQWDKIGCGQGTVLNFNCLAIRENHVIAYVSNQGAEFNNDCKSLFKKLKSNDELHFINITADSPFRKGERLNSIRLVLR